MLQRPRRNRKTKAIRSLQQEVFLNLQQLIYPLFIIDGVGIQEEIKSMPGIYRLSLDLILKEIEECIQLGIDSYIIFPVIQEELKDMTASYSYHEDCFYLKAITKIKMMFPNICLISDVAMDPYSSDGHDGLVTNGEIINDLTLPILSKMAIAQAKAGIDIIGPSDMMDGRIEYLRTELDNAGYIDVAIMAYSVKYASSFYGPFRDALDSAPKLGDKKTYQMSYTNRKEAIIEAELDYQEGADYLMVKPAMPYLDIISDLKHTFNLPIVAYQVSGEYAMLKAAISNGWLSSKEPIIESLYAIKRAGADIIITYFAKEYAQFIKP